MILALTFHENIPSIRFFAKNTKYTTAQLVEHLPEAIKKKYEQKNLIEGCPRIKEVSCLQLQSKKIFKCEE